MNNMYADYLELLTRRQNRGPFLILIGCFLLYMLSRTSESSPIVYGLAILLGVISLAGIFMTFRELGFEGDKIQAEPLPQSSDQLEHAINQLSKNYELLRRQTTQGFMLAAVFMILGVIVILSGSVGQMFGFISSGSNLTSVAGIIMEFISGTALLIYRINFKRLAETSDKLQETWKILTAFRLAESLPDEEKTKATMSLIQALLGTVLSFQNRPYNRKIDEL